MFTDFNCTYLRCKVSTSFHGTNYIMRLLVVFTCNNYKNINSSKLNNKFI